MEVKSVRHPPVKPEDDIHEKNLTNLGNHVFLISDVTRFGVDIIDREANLELVLWRQASIDQNNSDVGILSAGCHFLNSCQVRQSGFGDFMFHLNVLKLLDALFSSTIVEIFDLILDARSFGSGMLDGKFDCCSEVNVSIVFDLAILDS